MNLCNESCSSNQSAGLLCMTKTLTSDFAGKLFNPIFFIPAMLIDNIDFYRLWESWNLWSRSVLSVIVDYVLCIRFLENFTGILYFCFMHKVTRVEAVYFTVILYFCFMYKVTRVEAVYFTGILYFCSMHMIPE